MEWMFDTLGDFGGSTGQAWKDVLSGSGETAEELLAREALQNTSDAHDPGTQAPVHVRITRRVVQGAELRNLASVLLDGPALRKRLELLGPEKLGLSVHNTFSKLLAPDSAEVEITIVEDFNAVGLGGALPNEHGEAQTGDHFQKLLYLLGGTDKKTQGGSGGSFGYGKSVYSALSDARTVAYYSVFAPTLRSDGHHARFMVSANFDAHPFDGKNNTGRAYLAVPNARGGPTPAVDDAAHEWAERLGLQRRDRDQGGTTIVIFGTRLIMDRLRSEVERYWWPKLVDQELTVELYDGTTLLPPPSPKANESLRPYLACYEILARRQEPDVASGQRRGRLNALEGRQLGEWAAVRVEGPAENAEELDEGAFNKVALIRGAKMIVEYSSKPCLPGATVAIAGVFVASSEVDTVLKLSEPPAHNNWDPASLRLDDDGKHVVAALLDRLKRQVRNFHRELLPTTSSSQRKFRLLEELLGRLLEADPGVPTVEHQPDPFQVTHNLNRKEKDGAVRISGTVRIELRPDAEYENLKIEYAPRVEILENEDHSAGDELSPIGLAVKEGSANVEVRNKRTVVIGRLKKGRPILITVESPRTHLDWLLAYREELRAIEE